MAPIPLAKLNPNAKFSLTYHALSNKPHLAKRVCSALALSAEIDLQISLLIVRILGADANPAIAIFNTIRGGQWQEKALLAAISEVVPGCRSEVEIILDLAEAAKKNRHRFAHWIWGEAEDLPNVLLLVDPKHLRWHHIYTKNEL